MNLDLTGKNALVCGGSAGIGKACAIELAALGAAVTLGSRDTTKLESAIAQLPTPKGQRHGYIVLDTSKPQEAQDLLSAYLKQHGPCHILINNTGGPPSGAMADATAQQLQGAFDTLLLSAHLLTQAILPGMKHAQYGRIINISSTSVKQPIANLGLSNAIRAAVSNWAKTLSQEVARFGITVNTVLPGYTNTERLTQLFSAKSEKTGQPLDEITKETIASIPAGRLGDPQEIAAMVAFLATPAAAYINGVQIPVDGGRLGCL